MAGDQEHLTVWTSRGMSILALSHLKLQWPLGALADRLGLPLAVARQALLFFVSCEAAVLTDQDTVIFQAPMSICNYEHIADTLGLGSWAFRPFWRLGSTQSYCLSRCHDSDLEFCLAESQTAGRGRGANQWHSQFARGILFSYKKKLMPDFPISAYALMLSLIILRELRRVFPDLQLDIKWPNDILVNGKKLMGILIDVVWASHMPVMIVGLGCNFSGDQTEQDDKTISLTQAVSQSIDKTQITILLMQACRHAIEILSDNPFADFCQDYNQQHILHNMTVEFDLHGQSCRGVVVGVAHTGALCVQTTSDQVELFSSIDISKVRKAQG